MPSRLTAVISWLPGAAALVLWLVLFSRLANEWTVNPQYQFGWAVPFFGAYLLWERVRTKPQRDASGNGNGSLIAGALLLAIAWIPTRLILEAFPDWRPVLWAMALEASALTMLIIHASGGRAWVRHFAFPILFMLVAVPWPTPIENAAIQGLMKINAEIAANALTLFGHPAVQRGNLIEIGGGFVGVDEACSGMRSMQAALMIALLMGELFRFPTFRRILMLVAGLGIAFLTNVGRSLYLVSKAVSEGVESIAGVHDQAGHLTMAVCVAGLWVIGWLFRSRTAEEPSQPTTGGRSSSRSLPLFGAAILAVAISAEATTTVWFRASGAGEATRRPWNIELPAGQPGVVTGEVAGSVKEILGIDSGSAAAWSRADGSHWVAHLLRWEPAPVARAILAKYHTPEVCMPASGAILRSDLGRIDFTPNGIPLTFHQYEFEENGLPVQVFYLILEDRSAAHGRIVGSLVEERLRLVWEGRRLTGQTAVHVAIRGIDSPSLAAEALRHELASWISPLKDAADAPYTSVP